MKKRQSLSPPDNETLAYVAGLFDGEGCVNFTQAGKQRTWVIRVMIRNTDREIIEYLQSLFAGRIETKIAYPNKPLWKTSYCWRLDWDAAIEFLEVIEPWVRIKKDQILVARLWDVVRNRDKGRPTKDNKKVNDDKEMTELLVRQLAWLNRKGKRSDDDKEPMQEVLDTLDVPIEQILAEMEDAPDTLQ
jgi:hypothetical protein